jgi:tripartite-type tricarboxylate transporter receptor subunit TctC
VKPITLIVPWPAGSGADVVHRGAARIAERHLGKPIVVINRPGAAGTIGARFVEESTADGYTLGGVASTVVITQYTSANPTNWARYDPVATLTYDPALVAVRADSSWRTLRDMIAYAKANPGQVRIGNAGTGGAHHLFAAMLENAAGIKVEHFPYKGSSEVIVGVLGGQIQVVSGDTSAVYSQVQSGQLRILGMATDSRHADFPNVATYRDEGVDVVVGMRRLVVAPRGVPRPVIAALEEAYVKAVRDPEFTKVKGGWQPMALTAAETARVMGEDDRMVKGLVDQLKLDRQ